jgi:hypothetical protein
LVPKSVKDRDEPSFHRDVVSLYKRLLPVTDTKYSPEAKNKTIHMDREPISGGLGLQAEGMG